MASKVWYVPFDGEESEESICEKLRALWQASNLAGVLVADEVVGIKTHFGEKGNDSYVRPPFVKALVEQVRNAGGDPCLIETSTLYRGQRHNAIDHYNLAIEHGFGPEAMGCPLLFLDGLRGNLHVEQPVNLKHCDTVAVAGDFTLIPSALVVTHVTGHLLGGFGGAIKNVAMGLASRAGKMRQHSAGRPQVQQDDCIGCGTCVEWCPEDAIDMPQKARIDQEACIGCGECVSVCPVGAVSFGWDEPAESFNEKIAEYCYGILLEKRRNVGFVSFLHHITEHCNCMGEKYERVCPDLGILASADPVAIDQASVDLIAEAHGGDLFDELWEDRCYRAQLEHGEAIGLGSREYEMIRI